MRILIIGPGSIGSRHLRNLLSLGYDQLSVVSRSGVLQNEFSNLPVYTSISGALASNSFDVAIICSPTSNHSDDLRKLLDAKINKIYLEKPVSHSLEHMDELKELATTNGANITVGFDLHFDPGMQRVKHLITENTIGKVVSVNAVVGQYLPDWRPQQDYRIGMSAKKESGGGVMLDLIHEFDYLLWLMGSVDKISCQYSYTGALEIATEDVCDVLLRFKSRATGTIHLDYLQQKLVRNCMITGTEGSICWNLADRLVTWIDFSKNENQFSYENFDRNDRFIQIMKSFLQNESDERLTNFEQGIESLKLVIAAKYSSEHDVFVSPASFSFLSNN